MYIFPFYFKIVAGTISYNVHYSSARSNATRLK